MSHEHAAHADASDPFQRRVAVFMALFTVLIAFNGMLTSQARTKALLLSNKATNQWTYFQAKSTKQHIIEAAKVIMDRMPEHAAAEGEVKATVTSAGEAKRLEAEAVRYEKEKEEIKKQAEEITEQGEHQQHREHYFEYATVIAELSIVLASVALLLTSRPAFFLSLGTAVASLCLTIFTFLQ